MRRLYDLADIVVAMGSGILALFVLTSAFSMIKAAEAAPRDEVCFTPPGGCAAKALDVIKKAKKLRVQEYELTAPAFIDAFVAASARTHDVIIILDKAQRDVCEDLARRGVEAYVDTKHSKAHGKAIVADDLIVIDGSYNLSKSAERSNAEDMPIRANRARAKSYTDNFEVHLPHSIRCGQAPDGGTGG